MSEDKITEALPVTNILGWSASRSHTFYSCKRQYYYTYYSKYDADCPAARIRKLRELTSIPLATGIIVHEVAESVLRRLKKDDTPVDNNKLIISADKQTRAYCGNHSFSELYYKTLEKIDVDSISEKVKACTMNLLSSSRYKWLTELPRESKNAWVIEPPGFGETRLKDLKAYFKVDCLIPDGNKTFIIDWKTGTPDEKQDHKQVTGYVTWASAHLNVKAADIKPVLAYLQDTNAEVLLDITAEDVTSFVETVKAESQEMYTFCSDISQNIPCAKSTFIKTEDTGLCNHCNYRELCA